MDKINNTTDLITAKMIPSTTPNYALYITYRGITEEIDTRYPIFFD